MDIRTATTVGKGGNLGRWGGGKPVPRESVLFKGVTRKTQSAPKEYIVDIREMAVTRARNKVPFYPCTLPWE